MPAGHGTVRCQLCHHSVVLHIVPAGHVTVRCQLCRHSVVLHVCRWSLGSVVSAD